MKKIPLSQGKFALVDDADFDFLSQWKWYVNYDGYAVRSELFYKVDGKKSSKTIRMHRVILNTPVDLLTDHIDMNRLNNQRSNIRVATRAQNSMNVRSHKGSTSKFKGVDWSKKAKKWRAQLGIGKTKKFLGYFVTEDDAARAYNAEIKIHHGDFAKPNEGV